GGRGLAGARDARHGLAGLLAPVVRLGGPAGAVLPAVAAAGPARRRVGAGRVRTRSPAPRPGPPAHRHDGAGVAAIEALRPSAGWAPDGDGRTYALALLETVSFLSQARPALPVVASGVGQVRHLRRRLTMVLRGNTYRSLSWLGAAAVFSLGLLLLPLLPVG